MTFPHDVLFEFLIIWDSDFAIVVVKTLLLSEDFGVECVVGEVCLLDAAN